MKKTKEFFHLFVSYILPLFSFFIIFFLCMHCGRVVSSSMHPTIKVNDIVFANRLAYVTKDPERGDIILFKGSTGIVECKRIVGIPGDEITFHNGYVYINGIQCDETYLDENMETNCTKDFKVPENSFFVLGDNRVNSLDSRYLEEPYISMEHIVGKLCGKISL